MKKKNRKVREMLIERINSLEVTLANGKRDIKYNVGLSKTLLLLNINMLNMLEDK